MKACRHVCVCMCVCVCVLQYIRPERGIAVCCGGKRARQLRVCEGEETCHAMQIHVAPL